MRHIIFEEQGGRRYNYYICKDDAEMVSYLMNIDYGINDFVREESKHIFRTTIKDLIEGRTIIWNEHIKVSINEGEDIIDACKKLNMEGAIVNQKEPYRGHTTYRRDDILQKIRDIKMNDILGIQTVEDLYRRGIEGTIREASETYLQLND